MRKKIAQLDHYLGLDLSDDEVDKIIKLTYSSTAQKADVNNDMPLEYLQNALVMVAITDYAKEHLNLSVNSCYRNVIVNKLVGGAKNSKHMEFKAVDFQLPRWTTDHEINDYIAQFSKLLHPFAYIDYFYKKGNMLHIQFNYH